MKNHTSKKNLLFPVAVVLVLIGSLVALRSVEAQTTDVSAQDIQRWSVPNGAIITMFRDGNILASACQSCPSQIINHRTGSTINPNFPGVTGVAFARPAIRLSSTESDSVIGGWENQWRFSKDAVQKWVKPVGCCNSASTPWALDTATNKAYMVGGVLNGMGEVDMNSGLYVNPGPFTPPNFAWSAEPVFVSMADSDKFYLAARTGWVARLYPFNTTQWQITIDPSLGLQPGAIASDGSFIVTSGAPHFNAESLGPQPGRLARVLTDGTVAFNSMINAVTPPVIGGNGLIFVGTQSAPIDVNGTGAVTAYDLNGNQIWSTAVHGLPNDLLVGNDGAVYAGTGAFNSGRVYILDQNTGAIRKTITNVPGAWEMMLSGGVVYTTGAAITALPVDAVNYDPMSPWPLRFHDNQRTGNRLSPILAPPRESAPVNCSGVDWFEWSTSAGGNGHFFANAGPYLNWHDAENAAEAQGATLVTLTSQAERNFVVSTFMADRNVYWLGGTDETTEGNFRWVTGEPFSYTDWVGGEPNNYGGAENYLAANWHVARDGMNAGQGMGNFGRWNDVTVNGSDAATGPVGPYMALFERNSAPVCGDQEPPITTAMNSPAANGAGWNNTDVGVNLSAQDEASGSGVESITYSVTGAQAIASTTVNAATTSFTISDEGETTITYYATDAAGNHESPKTIVIKIDKTAPTISVTSPTTGSYLLNQVATVDFGCTDNLSGVASCTGSSPSGSALDTTSIGSHSVTVSAIDVAGNASAPMVVNYTVAYGIVALYDQTKAHKSGSTIPIKIRLVDASGANVSSASTVVHAVSVIQVSSQASTDFGDSGNSNPDFDFRYDASLGGYIFNLKTTGFGTGSYLLSFVAGNSPTVYSVGFQVRQ
jgi:hypothetical protein